MKAKFLSVILLLLLLSCEVEEPQFYHSNFYAYSDKSDHKSSFFVDTIISFRITSRLDYKDLSWEGRFIDILDNTADFYSDRYFILNDDTIKPYTNLLKNSILSDYISYELLKVPRSGGFVNDSYIIRLNKNNSNDFKINKGYFVFYFNAITVNDNFISDSTLIFVK